MVDAFGWDEDKAEQNAQSHGVTFEEARSVFEDAGRVEFFDEEHSEDEGRYVVIGFSRTGQLLFVEFTPRGQQIRIISARAAESDEEEIYGQNN
jgi:uncharacterized protein